MESNTSGNNNSKGYTLDGTVDLSGRPVLAAKTGRWKACAFLVTYEVFERMAFYGIASNLVVYLTTQLHEDTVSSVRNVNNWSGSIWMTPIAGAYVADAYLGRFWTFTLFSIIYVVGMVMLTVAVSLKSMRPSCHVEITQATSPTPCISKATPTQIAFFYTALYTIVVGAGCTKPNISTLGADQFDSLDRHEKQLKASFFNWWMFSAFLGALFANLGLVYIQENLGWSLGYAIPTVGLTLSLVAFYVGSPFYRHKPRVGVKEAALSDVNEDFYCKSPAKEVVRVVLGVLRNSWVRVPDDPKLLHEVDYRSYVRVGRRQMPHTRTFRFLDKAAIRKEGCNKNLPCTITQVEKTKLILGMLMIWLTMIIPSIIWAQVNTLFVKQGTTLDRHIGGSSFQIPAASLSSFITITLLFAVPLYDRYFVPFMRKRTGNARGITLLQRLAIGCIFQIFSVGFAYVVELRRMQVIRVDKILGPKETVPMSIMWLLPQYIMLGVGDVFNAIGLLEFFYDQSPDDMQSLGTTFFTSAIGVGNFLNGLLITMVDKVTMSGRHGKSWIGNNLNDSHLDYYYGFLVVIATVNLGLFFWASNTYVYKKEPDGNKLEVDESGNVCVVEEKI